MQGDDKRKQIALRNEEKGKCHPHPRPCRRESRGQHTRVGGTPSLYSSLVREKSKGFTVLIPAISFQVTMRILIRLQVNTSLTLQGSWALCQAAHVLKHLEFVIALRFSGWPLRSGCCYLSILQMKKSRLRTLKKLSGCCMAEPRAPESVVIPLCLSGSEAFLCSLSREGFQFWDKNWIVSNGRTQELDPAPAITMAMPSQLSPVLHE